MALINNLEDNDSVDDILKESDFAKSLINVDNFKELIHTDKSFRSFMDSMNDRYSTKALETWKENNLQKLIDEKIKELYPEDDPKDLELKKVQQELERMKREAQTEKLRTVALKTASEKKLPTDLVDYFLGQDEDSTLENLNKLEKIMTSHLETQVKERLKDNSYIPPKGGEPIPNSYDALVSNADNLTAEQIAEQFSNLK